MLQMWPSAGTPGRKPHAQQREAGGCSCFAMAGDGFVFTRAYDATRGRLYQHVAPQHGQPDKQAGFHSHFHSQSVSLCFSFTLSRSLSLWLSLSLSLFAFPSPTCTPTEGRALSLSLPLSLYLYVSLSLSFSLLHSLPLLLKLSLPLSACLSRQVLSARRRPFQKPSVGRKWQGTCLFDKPNRA